MYWTAKKIKDDWLTIDWIGGNNFYKSTVRHILNNGGEELKITFTDHSETFKGAIAHVNGEQLTKKRIKYKELKSLFECVR